MTEVFETKILIGQNEDEFQARIRELERSGWVVDTSLESELEIVGSVEQLTYITRLNRYTIISSWKVSLADLRKEKDDSDLVDTLESIFQKLDNLSWEL